MSNTSRVDKELFEGSHYLGKPADVSDLIIDRRIEILRRFPEFFDIKENLLEIGCGNGVTLIKLSGEFQHLLGLEYVGAHQSEFEKLKKEASANHAFFEVWDISEKPYKSKFQRLISFEVIEHLPSEDNVAHYAQSLEIGALCAITVPNKWWIFETHGAKLPLLPWNRVPFFSWLPTPIHERFANARIYTKKRIIKLMQKHGFEVLATEYVTAPMDVIKWRPLQNFLRNYIFKNATTKNPFTAVSIFLLARKK